MAIFQKALDPHFKWEVAGRPGSALVLRCFDCGSCAGICPVSEAYPEFDPRKIIHQLKVGLKDQLLRSPALWYCTHCHTCAFCCPQEVTFSDLVEVLREMALQQGYADPQVYLPWATAPCQAACPAHVSIPGFISAILQGKYAEGVKLIKRDLPFPGICGRVCPHPCEAKCNRSRLDEPLAIMHLKRFLADAYRSGMEGGAAALKENRGEKVAVIGAGPAGLTAAYYLALKGYQVTVFEKAPVAGGMMALGIPAFRLPRDVLHREIAEIEALGVEIRLNCEVGRDVSFSNIKREFDAIFISIGLHQAQKMGLPGEDELHGVMDGITFLREVNLDRPPEFSGRVAVIGGGNVAVDCARAARRLGYGPVTILYRRTRDEMPAYPEEVENALHEGVEIQFLTAPVAIEGEGGKVTGLTCQHLELGEPDASGRRRPLPVPGSEFSFPCEVVISAIGQASDHDFFAALEGVEVSGKNLLVVDQVTGATGSPGIFAGGDVVSGPHTVVAAIAAAKEAAISMDRYLKGQDLQLGRPKRWQGLAFVPQGLEFQPREAIACLPQALRVRTFKEVELGFTEEQARREATRCLRLCGLQKNPG
jgi:NADPH-dependent glutamate synthase beta subunit-like oxidoreductase